MRDNEKRQERLHINKKKQDDNREKGRERTLERAIDEKMNDPPTQPFFIEGVLGIKNLFSESWWERPKT